jgi:hypothetical protein
MITTPPFYYSVFVAGTVHSTTAAALSATATACGLTFFLVTDQAPDDKENDKRKNYCDNYSSDGHNNDSFNYSIYYYLLTLTFAVSFVASL